MSRRLSSIRRTFSSLRPEPQHAEKLTSLGTRRIFNEDHDALRDVARKFFEERVVPFHQQWEIEGQISRECWKEAGERGLLCVTMPEAYGGLGLNILSSAVIWEEQSYTGCTGPGFSLHSEIVAPYILNYGTEAQKQKFLPKLASGEMIGAIAMSEPAAGSDLQGMRTTCLPKGADGLRLNGSKTFMCDFLVSQCVF
jgi:long-chain-acyl-CoA dehydrogenase